MVFTVVGSILITQICGIIWGYGPIVVFLGGLAGAGLGYWAAILEDKRYERELHKARRNIQKD